ncbi:MAG: VOC family protein [Proteobacteria bacterium]|nr:VOC family protein [Pseudomonadota bacterium]
MALSALDHFTIVTADLDASVAFYTGILGLADGPRPAFDGPGAWLYCGDRPAVHLVGGGGGKDTGTGAIDHVAFRASGLDDHRARLDERGIAYRERDVPGQPLHQLFLTDPDGVTIEINFRDEA